MKTGNKKGVSQLWKRNAVVAVIAVFVCAAVYLNWSYEQEAGKTLGESTMVGKEDPLVSGSSSSDSSSSSQQDDAAQQGDQSSTDGQQTGAESGDDYFANARLNRQQSRDSALSLLQDAAAREDADQTLRDEANQSIQTMADYTVTEAQIENMIVAKGHTVVIVEHNMDVIKCADWVIDLGPEAGERGGRLVFEGTPDELARCPQSYTGKYLSLTRKTGR